MTPCDREPPNLVGFPAMKQTPDNSLSAGDRELILTGRKRFLSEAELSLYLGKSTRWIREARRKRILPSVKVGGASRYETSRIDEALRALERPSVLASKGGRK